MIRVTTSKPRICSKRFIKPQTSSKCFTQTKRGKRLIAKRLRFLHRLRLRSSKLNSRLPRNSKKSRRLCRLRSPLKASSMSAQASLLSWRSSAVALTLFCPVFQAKFVLLPQGLACMGAKGSNGWHEYLFLYFCSCDD